MKKVLCISIIMLVSFSKLTFGFDATPMQLFYITKTAFPEIHEIAIFISPERLEKEKVKIERALAGQQLKGRIYKIRMSTDIGRRLKEMKDNSVLVIFSSDVLMDKKSKLYILSKCKSKKISLITSSHDYSDTGALLGVIPNSENKLDIILNLKHNEYLAPLFTEDTILKMGVCQVIK